MSEEIIKVFDYLGEKLGIVIDWTQENILPYLQDLLGRYVTFNIVIHAIGLFLGVAGTIFAIVMLVHIYLRANRDNSCFWYDNSFGGKEVSMTGFGFTLVSGFTSFFSLIALIYNSVELLKWIFIPEFQLIEDLTYYISTL